MAFQMNFHSEKNQIEAIPRCQTMANRGRLMSAVNVTNRSQKPSATRWGRSLWTRKSILVTQPSRPRSHRATEIAQRNPIRDSSHIENSANFSKFRTLFTPPSLYTKTPDTKNYHFQLSRLTRTNLWCMKVDENWKIKIIEASWNTVYKLYFQTM